MVNKYETPRASGGGQDLAPYPIFLSGTVILWQLKVYMIQSINKKIGISFCSL